MKDGWCGDSETTMARVAADDRAAVDKAGQFGEETVDLIVVDGSDCSGMGTVKGHYKVSKLPSDANSKWVTRMHAKATTNRQ
jgi:hypothetical protein